MSAPLTPAWLSQLAPTATMISSVLRRPVQGRGAIVKVVQAAGELYESHAVVFNAQFADRELIEYDALAFGGLPVHGVLTLTRNSSGEIVNVGIHHGPLDAINKLSAALKVKLGADLGVEYFRT